MIALVTPMPPEAGGDYLAGRVGLMAMLASLAAQEAERGVAARVWENGAIRAVLADSGDAQASGGEDRDLSWSALDQTNADLRRRLIAVHEAAETSGDRALEAQILELYVRMAAARRLDLPGG
jgi:hypothetical protein